MHLILHFHLILVLSSDLFLLPFKFFEENKLKLTTVEPGYNDIGYCDTLYIASDILWYQLIPHC